MSQFFTGVTASNLPSNIPTSFTTDLQDTTTASFPVATGTVVPQANILRATGINGIQTYQSTLVPGVLEIGYNSGRVTTTDGSTVTALTIIPVNNSAQAYQFLIVGYDAINGICFGGQLVAICRVVAGVATVLPVPDKFFDQDAALASAAFSITASGSSVLVQVTGVVGHTIDWAVINAAGVVTAT